MISCFDVGAGEGFGGAAGPRDVIRPQDFDRVAQMVSLLATDVHIVGDIVDRLSDNILKFLRLEVGDLYNLDHGDFVKLWIAASKKFGELDAEDVKRFVSRIKSNPELWHEVCTVLQRHSGVEGESLLPLAQAVLESKKDRRAAYYNKDLGGVQSHFGVFAGVIIVLWLIWVARGLVGALKSNFESQFR